MTSTPAGDLITNDRIKNAMTQEMTELKIRWQRGALTLLDLIHLHLTWNGTETNVDEASDATFDEWVRQFCIPNPRRKELYSLERRRDLLNIISRGSGEKPNFKFDQPNLSAPEPNKIFDVWCPACDAAFSLEEVDVLICPHCDGRLESLLDDDGDIGQLI